LGIVGSLIFKAERKKKKWVKQYLLTEMV
jgi:hypothetical protein